MIKNASTSLGLSEGNAKQGILHFLKQNGPSDAASIARQFAVTGMAIRQHLYAMQRSGLIAYQERKRPLGRPAKLWHLTPRTHQFFPDAHAELAVSLLQGLGKTFGPEGVSKLLAQRMRTQVANYENEIQSSAALGSRLKRLCAIREREGYMPQVERQSDGSFLFIENHCPICSAAKACSGFCSSELEVFQKVLGKDCKVERVEHLLAGARRCAYRVSGE